MNILVDDRWFGNSGIGRYAREILGRKPDSHKVVPVGKSWKIRNPVSPLLLGCAINHSNVDLFWSPGFIPPAWCNVPYVVTIHDLIHLHYGNIFHRLYYHQVIRSLLKKAAAVLTVSEYSRDEILMWSGLTSDRLRVIPDGISDGFKEVGPVYNLGYPYILYIGNRRIHKNIHRLIKAFGIAHTNSDVRLALSGPADPELLALARKIGIGNRIVFLGNIKEPNLPSVYRGALAVAYVSLYEGFGIPPLEAMACGTPVLTSNVTSIPEVVGDAALKVDPFDTEAIAAGLRRISEDSILRDDLRRKGLKRAKLFDWDVTASQTWEALEQVSQTSKCR